MSKANPPLPGQNGTTELVPVIEYQEMAPSPNSTYYHIAVYPAPASTGLTKKSSFRRKNKEERRVALKLDQMKSGCVVVRDWPRRRMSQHWTREGAVNPNETVITYQDFIDGEMDSQLINIFGKNRYDMVYQAVEKEIAKTNK